MRGRRAAGVFAAAFLACLAGLAGADTPAAERPELATAVTQHSGVFGGASLGYTATAGQTVVHGADGAPVASIFSVAYVAGGGADRPVIFAYNGGPGSSAGYLHLGALGPERADFPTDLRAPATPPFTVSPNPDSLLDVADIVLIDPPETGFSRTLPGDLKQSYATIFGDAQIVADFIRTWLRDNHREASPKFILGESYGATRTPLVAADLLDGAGGRSDVVHLTGILLLSQMLTVDDLGDRPMNAAGYAVTLPSIAAVAWHHGRVDKRGRTLTGFLAEARRFAYRDYMPALMLGDALPPEDRARIAARLAAFSGLSEKLILDSDLKLDAALFRRSLYPGQLVGGYDGRYVGPPAASIADPGQRQTVPTIDGALARYLPEVLHVAADRPYVLENHKLGAAWNFGDRSRKPATTFLTDYLARQPDVRLFVAGGYDDLVTPFTTSQFLVAHLPLPPRHAEFHAYEGGHMFYSDKASLDAFAADARAFIRAAVRGR